MVLLKILKPIQTPLLWRNLQIQNGTLAVVTTCLLCQQQKRYAGHSKWANIKFKKMHKDNARAKVFGQLSREIIQAVKEKGADPVYNAKLEGLVLKARSSSMPKERIENSIKNALRSSYEKATQSLFQARGPMKCGLMIDVLAPNVIRTKNEIKTILKKNDATFISDGSVAFMFDHKGVVTIKDKLSKPSENGGDIVEVVADEHAIDQAEEIAIEVGAEDVHFSYNEQLDQRVIQFLCQPLEIQTIRKEMEEKHQQLEILSADVQYLAKSLVDLDEHNMTQADRLIELITNHPDVLNVYDNIVGYPSSTIKIDQTFT
eukprot:TCONS_00061900-protein